MKYAVIIYDNLVPELEPVRQNLIDFTTTCTFLYVVENYQTSNITTTLTELAEKDIEYAIVVAAGNFVKNKNLIFSEIIKLMEKEQTPLMCHIMDKDGYFHFDPQFFVIKLDVYKQLNCPKLEEENVGVYIETKETLRSPDNVHDDYTPWWLRSKNNAATYKSGRSWFGTHFIAALMRNNFKVINFPHSIREKKIYGYPNKNWEEHIKMVKDHNTDTWYFNNDDFKPLMWHKNKTMYYYAKDIDALLHRDAYYPLNTEPMATRLSSTGNKFDCFIGVCGGIKPAMITGSDYFQDNATVALFDFSKAAIEWQKYLLTHWNGNTEDLETVFAKFQLYNNDYDWKLQGTDINSVMTKWMSDNTISQQQVYDRWQKYKRMKHHFLQIDLLGPNAMDQIVEIQRNCNPTQSYIWLSNVFHMDYTDLFHTKNQMRALALRQMIRLRNMAVGTTILEWCNRTIELKWDNDLEKFIKNQ